MRVWVRVLLPGRKQYKKALRLSEMKIKLEDVLNRLLVVFCLPYLKCWEELRLKKTKQQLHLLPLNEWSDRHAMPLCLLDFNELLLQQLHSVRTFSRSPLPRFMRGKKTTKQHMSHRWNTHARESGSLHSPATTRNTSTTRGPSCTAVACRTHVLNESCRSN